MLSYLLAAGQKEKFNTLYNKYRYEISLFNKGEPAAKHLLVFDSVRCYKESECFSFMFNKTSEESFANIMNNLEYNITLSEMSDADRSEFLIKTLPNDYPPDANPYDRINNELMSSPLNIWHN